MKKKRSHLEQGFDRLFASMAPTMPMPEREFYFAKPRMWRFDFCWPEAKVAVEIDGGIFVGGGHSRGVQFTGDCEKINEATERGWRVFRYTTLDLRQRPVQCVEQVVRMLEKAAGVGQKGLFA